jgi:hypothetical protein
VGLRFLRTLTNDTAFEAAAGGARRAARLRRILDLCVFKVSRNAGFVLCGDLQGRSSGGRVVGALLHHAQDQLL